MMHRLQRCKRDALPTELTALHSEMAGFRPFLKGRIRRLVERRGNERHQTALRVPNYSRSPAGVRRFVDRYVRWWIALLIFAAGAFTGIGIEAAVIPHIFPKILHAHGGVIVPRHMLEELRR